jgi:hypothetical protein
MDRFFSKQLTMFIVFAATHTGFGPGLRSQILTVLSTDEVDIIPGIDLLNEIPETAAGCAFSIHVDFLVRTSKHETVPSSTATWNSSRIKHSDFRC